jgi:hypothetical protein
MCTERELAGRTRRSTITTGAPSAPRSRRSRGRRRPARRPRPRSARAPCPPRSQPGRPEPRQRDLPDRHQQDRIRGACRRCGLTPGSARRSVSPSPRPPSSPSDWPGACRRGTRSGCAPPCWSPRPPRSPTSPPRSTSASPRSGRISMRWRTGCGRSASA